MSVLSLRRPKAPMAISPQFKEYLAELFEPVAPITVRGMFGGAGVFKETSKGRVMFALVIQEVIYLKTGPENVADYEELGLEPFSYDAKGKPRAIKTLRQMPEVCHDDSDTLKQWAMKAIDAAVAAKK